MKAVVFTPTSLFRLSGFSITEPWFEAFGLPEDAAGLKRVIVNDVVYLLEKSLDDEDAPIIVVNQTGDHAVFAANTLSINAFERMSTVARRIYTTSVAIPTTWRPHYEGTLWSVYAAFRDRGAGARLHFETRPAGRKDLFVFARTEEVKDFHKVPRDDAIYEDARRHLAEAILTQSPDSGADRSRAGIILSQRLPQGFVQGASLEEWYASKLTEEQREFVDKPYDGPVRLRGAAGTGKTLSLVVKFLRDAAQFAAAKEKVSLGFLTHSHGSVDLVNAIALSLDHTGLIHGTAGNCRIEIRTLYDLAHEHLRFELDELVPLSLDGREGRRLQFELIEALLIEMHSSPVVRAQFSDVTPELGARWAAAARKSEPRFVAEIMNEFASVLDAEGIRAGEERGERYARGTGYRPAWLMRLDHEQDRRFLLEVHRRYRRMLGEMNTLSVDQMVADFNSFLDSNRWDRIRDRQGYDALFVDELHLFTAVERQTLHKLIKRKSEEGVPKRPPIFMAYDLKQSPRDAFTQYGEADNNLFAPTTGLQNADLVKLSKVFRYTPEIAKFLEDLDAAFPAIDIPGEWEAYAGEAQLASGNVPELTVFKDERSLFKRVFEDAVQHARSNPGGGRRVAVLCPSEEIFDVYLKAATGQYAGKFLPIVSREPVTELRHAGKRFIFSMPEYVAGLQFEMVFLIHVDTREAPIDAGLGVRRRFISNVYLGSSRAEQVLRLSACASRGGASDILNLALERRTLKQVPAR